MGGQGSGPRKSKKDAKEKADEQSQRMRERRAEESRAEAEATAEQMRRHHRPIDSFFSRGAAAATAAATAATAEGSASSSTASGVRETGASPGEATDARRVGASLREDEEEDRSFNETARELEQLHMAFAVQNSLRDQQQGTRSARIGAGTTDEPDSTSTLRGSNPQRLAALTSLAQSRSEDELRQTLRELYSQVATGTSDDLQAIPETVDVAVTRLLHVMNVVADEAVEFHLGEQIKLLVRTRLRRQQSSVGCDDADDRAQQVDVLRSRLCYLSFKSATASGEELEAMPATIDSIVTELAQLPDDRPPNGRMPAAMFGDAIKRHVQTRQTALAETAALHAERATNERECGSTHAGLGGHDANTGQEGSSARSVDDDEQDVDDETLKRLDPRSHIGAIAERMPSLHLIAFAVRCCTHRYVLSGDAYRIDGGESR